MDPSLQESNYKNKWHQRLTNLSEIMYSKGSEFILFLTKPYSMMNSYHEFLFGRFNVHDGEKKFHAPLMCF